MSPPVVATSHSSWVLWQGGQGGSDLSGDPSGNRRPSRFWGNPPENKTFSWRETAMSSHATHVAQATSSLICFVDSDARSTAPPDYRIRIPGTRKPSTRRSQASRRRAGPATLGPDARMREGHRSSGYTPAGYFPCLCTDVYAEISFHEPPPSETTADEQLMPEQFHGETAMCIRGPKSAEALVTPTVAELRGDARPEPPADLTEGQAAEGRAVVDACRRGSSTRSSAPHTRRAGFHDRGAQLISSAWQCVPRDL
jgi:hypothetical protein